MVEFVNELIGVEVQVRRDGKNRPLAFVWQGRRYQIESWGREGIETRDERSMHCHLVQTAGPETWELCQDTETAQWALTRYWARDPRIV